MSVKAEGPLKDIIEAMSVKAERPLKDAIKATFVEVPRNGMASVGPQDAIKAGAGRVPEQVGPVGYKVSPVVRERKSARFAIN